MNKENGSDDKYDLKEQLDTVTRNLKDRDTEFKVTIDSNVFIIHLTDIKVLLHRQDVQQKSHKQQLSNEIKKKKALTAELQKAEGRIQQLDDVLKVCFLCDKMLSNCHTFRKKIK